jgi:putative intracellular protease/amidase
MTWASPKGGAAPCDEGSIAASKEDKSCMDFIEGEATKALVDNTVALSTLTDLTSFDAVFFAGGFGTMWDFPDDPDVQRIAAAMWESGKVVSAVCHGPCALVNVTLSDGTKLVAGKEVAAFTNEEEDAVKCREVVPFTCEDKFKEVGATYTKGGVFQAHVAVAGKLITGQNPPSAKPTAEAVIAALS